MLSQEALNELFVSHFPPGTPMKEISDRLATMQSIHLNDLRNTFCNELLYTISEGYIKYECLDFATDPLVTSFCDNVKLLPSEDHYFRSVRAFS